jgi:outer membrane protein assembly factor BamB
LELETSRIISGVSVGYNTFLYADADGVIYAHDSISGDLKWTKPLEDVVLSEILITSTAVYVQTSSDVLYGLNLQNGETKWSKKAQAPLLSIRGTSSPVAFEGLIFTSFSNGRLAAVRELDGIQLWEKPISRLKGSTELEKLMDADSQAVPVNEDIFAANYNGSLTRFNIRAGEKVFSVDHSTLKPIILHKNIIASINTDEEILGFNAVNGTEIWRSQKFKNRDITDLVLHDDKLYFGDFEGYVHEINPANGMITGLTKTNLKAINQIEIYSDKLIAQDIDGSISGFDLN